MRRSSTHTATARSSPFFSTGGVRTGARQSKPSRASAGAGTGGAPSPFQTISAFSNTCWSARTLAGRTTNGAPSAVAGHRVRGHSILAASRVHHRNALRASGLSRRSWCLARRCATHRRGGSLDVSTLASLPHRVRRARCGPLQVSITTLLVPHVPETG
jgi:hypothetical protein